MENRLMNDTKTVKIGDAEFVIGVISFRIWQRIKSTYSASLRPFLMANDRYKGKSASEITEIVTAEIGEDRMIKLDELYARARWEAVQYGVKSHSGVKDKNGNEIKLIKDDGGLVASETIENYARLGYLTTLSTEISDFQKSDEQDLKN